LRILIDVSHPAHVHLFKNFAAEMQKRGHSILFTCRDKEHVIALLDSIGFRYANFGKHYKKMVGKVFGLAKNELQLIQTCIGFKPDVFLSHNSTLAAVASSLFRKPHIAFEDTFNMEQVRLSMPFTDVVLTGDYTHPCLGAKEIKYPGYHELAYLYPGYFAPDPQIIDELGINKDERYAVLRFIAWNATHDVGHKGISDENKHRLVRELSEQLRVFISAEYDLPTEYKPYALNIRPERIHDVLCYAHLFVGESATMASESAILGTPAIFIHNKRFGSIDDQAQYGLIYQYDESGSGQLQAIQKAVEMAGDSEAKSKALLGTERLLNAKIDVTSFLVWFVEHYPESAMAAHGKGLDFARFRS
jgi:predicted glycosyltransferase